MKKLFFMAMIPLSLALLSFVEDCPDAGIVQLENGNYISEEPVFINADDEARLDELMDINPELAAAGFFWSCYTKTDCKFQHGRIAGGGCCTSGIAEEDLEPFQVDIINNVRLEIDEIMTHYMY